jgi:hypothetical protein
MRLKEFTSPVNEVAFVAPVLAGLQAIWSSGMMQTAMTALNYYATYEGIKYITDTIVAKGRDPQTIDAEELGIIVMNLLLLYLQKSKLVADTSTIMSNIPRDTIKRVGEFIRQRLPRTPQ